jgi:hypothetical protein
MFDFQASLIFPTHAVPPAGPPPPGSKRLSIESADESRLEGIHIPGSSNDPERLLILGFGGNAWNAQDVAEYLHQLFPENDIITFHYRGYAPSTGSPSAEALIADAPLIYDFAIERVRPKRIVAVGFSIGSGIAAELAARRTVDGLILVTPFDSLKLVAQAMYPWLPIGHFFEHEIDEAAAVEKGALPVAILAARNDEIVPAARTDALRERVLRLVFDRTISGAGHNDLYARSEFQDDMRAALAAVIGSASA